MAELIERQHIQKHNSSMHVTGSLFDNLPQHDVSESMEHNVQLPENNEPKQSLRERLYTVVQSLLIEMLDKPMNEKEVAEELNVSRSQAAAWLALLVKEDKLTKLTKPVRYIIKQ